MNLHRLLQQRAAAGKPVRVGLIGAGKFGSMFLTQVPTTPGLEVAVIADLDPDRARDACRTVGWDAQPDRADPVRRTRAPRPAPIRRSRSSSRRPAARRPASPMRWRRSRPASTSSWSMSRPTCWPARCWPRRRGRKGVVYSLAYGDQPALICELVDWARACGFEVVAAGKGTKYLPAYHAVTPDDVWAHYGLTPEEARRGGHEPADVQLLPRRHQVGDRDGGGRQRRPGSTCRDDGLGFPPCGVDDLPHVLRGRASGRRAGTRRHGRGRLVAGARRPAGVPRPALGRLCRAEGAERLRRAPASSEYGLQDRRQRPLRGDVQALPPDRPGARHLGAVGGAARRADRPAASAGAAMSSRSPSATCRPARCSTARAATRSGASWCRPSAASPRARCRSGWRTMSGSKRDIGAGDIVRWADVEMPDSEAVTARRDMERRFAPPPAPTMGQAAQ